MGDLHTELVESLHHHAKVYIQHPTAQWQIRLVTPNLTKNEFYRILSVLRNTKDMTEETPKEYLEVRPDGDISLQLHDLSGIHNYCLNEGYESVENLQWLQRQGFEHIDLPLIYTTPQVSVVAEWKPLETTPTWSESWTALKKKYRYVVRYVYTYNASIDYVIEVRKSTKNTFQTMKDANVPYVPEEYHLSVILRPGVKMAETDTYINDLSRMIYRHSLRLMQIVRNEPGLLTRAEANGVLRNYSNIIHRHRAPQYDPVKRDPDSTKFFLAPKPITLERTQLIEPGKVYCVTSVLEDYVVSEKADGERMLLYVDGVGDSFLLNNILQPKRTGLKCTAKEYFQTILDGEFVLNHHLYDKTNTKDLFAVFDVYFVNGKNVSQFPLISKENESRKDNRYTLMQLICHPSRWNTSESIISIRSKVHRRGDKGEMFKHCSDILREAQEQKTWYPIDGLIFTPAYLPVLGYYPGKKVDFPLNMRWDRVYKWKPADMNTIDFLVRKGRKLPTQDGHRYQEFILRTGFNVDQTLNMTVQKGLELLNNPNEQKKMRYGEGLYIPHDFKPFSHYEDDVHLAYVLLDESDLARTESGEAIHDDTIVEFRYDITDTRKASYRWRPLRIRDDKTRIYRQVDDKGNKTLSKTANDISTASSVWRSIHRPVTIEMIEGRDIIPVEEASSCIEDRLANDDDVYYAREIPRFHLLSKSMLDFHNNVIKEQLYKRSPSKSSLLELACGRAGDMIRWISNKYYFVLGIDYASDNIIDPKQGSYARTIQRYMSTYRDVQMKKIDHDHLRNFPKITYAVGDCSLPINDGTCSQEKDTDSTTLLHYLFDKRSPKSNPFHKIIPALCGRASDGFSVVSCQFAIHYFCESREKLDGFFNNVIKNLNTGGFFITTFMDGERVSALLQNKERVEGRVNEKVVWAILKCYEGDLSARSPYGNRIRVYLENINQLIPEYLVHFSNLVEYAQNRGLRLVESETFDVSFMKAKALMKHKNNKMDRIVNEFDKQHENIKKFSYLNRWVVFQKQ